MGKGLAILGVPGVLGGGGGGITWLLRDEFTTDDAAPLASPRTCEPGPGTLTLVQNDGTMSVIGGALSIVAQTTPNWDDQKLYSGALVTPSVRTAGRTIIVSKEAGTNNWIYLAPPVGGLPTGAGILNSGGLYTTNPAFSGLNEISMSIPSPWAMVLQTTGRLYFGYSGGAWSLYWVSLFGTAADSAVYVNNYNGTYTIDHIRVRQIDVLANVAALDVNPGVSGTSYTAVANAIHDLAVTAPNPLANTCELRYRVLDDQNYWTAYFNDAGAFRVDSVSGGMATNRVNVAGVIAAGETHTIRITADGTKHNAYTLLGTTWTKRGDEVDVSHQDAQTTVKPVAGAGWTLGRLTSWPRTSAAYAELDKV